MRDNADVPPGGEQYWPTPIRDRCWTDSEGRQWRMRGRELDARAARRLLSRPDGIALHVNGPDPERLQGDALSAVVFRLSQFFAGIADPHSDFRVAEFRDDQRNVLVVIEESC